MQDLRWPVYTPRGITLDRADVVPGRGSFHVFDTEGRRYLDAVTGIGCQPLGHAHPRWVAAIHEQLGRLATAANTYFTGPQQALAGKLAALSSIPDAAAFFTNSGTESTEAALKLALRVTGKTTVIAFDRAFHGRSLGALSLTANASYRAPYVQCLDDAPGPHFATARVIRVPFGDLLAVDRELDRHAGQVAAIFVEPIQGEAGVYPGTREFLVGLRERCVAAGALLGVDEIQSGSGRTGTLTAWETIVGRDAKLSPDLAWFAKAIAGGFPMGACIARGELARAMPVGSHGTTFGGNPLACAAALATFAIAEEEGLWASAARQHGLLLQIAAEDPEPRVKEIRGLGAILGIELEGGATGVDREMAKEGVLVTVCASKTVRLLLPYAAGQDELRTVWRALRAAVARTPAAPPA